MKMQKFVQAVMLLLALGAAAYSSNLRAEDIDIYVDNAAAAGTAPNVLFLIDNSSNLAATWGGGGCSAYANTSEAPSLGTNTAGGIVQCALVDAINSLPDGNLNIGIMAGNSNGFGTDKGCIGKDGGCLLVPLTLMNASSKPAMIAFVKSWIKQNSTNGGYPFTVQSVGTGGIMQEAWAYYNGRTGLSGRSYSPSILQGCQKNFAIFIGNTDKSTVNDDISGTSALSAAGATTQNGLLNKISTTVEFKPPMCATNTFAGVSSVPAGTSQNDWSSNWADEWARLMVMQDGGTSTMEGMQNITTYTIGIVDNGSNTCTSNVSTPALLQSMANAGGGKAFRVGDASAIKEALATTLNEVQAVNSVFSSASLPVSVNAEGSYLNQIFLGMFRPDSSGAPRWRGNLKQYHLVRNAGGQLVMGDALDQPAITSGGTGFLTPGAVSFWTYKDTANLPDSVGGFFVNDKKGTPPGPFDSADGEVVEKGGVAQQLRKQNIQATFTGASASTGNPRRVYTYCPDNTNCNDDLTAADNDFSTTNSRIAADQFGSAVTIPVQSIVRNGSIATITTAVNHGFSGNSIVTIRNATQPEYNRTQAITVTGTNTFTMTGLPDYPATPTTVAYTVSVPGAAGSFALTKMQRATSAAGSANETVTATTGANHPYLVGQTVQISGASAFNGNQVITGIPAPNQFTFSVPIYPTSPAAARYTVTNAGSAVAISSITEGSGGLYTVVTTAVNGFHPLQTVTISGLNGNKRAFNADWVVQSVAVDGKTFTIRGSTGLGNVSNGGNVGPTLTAQPAASVTRNGTTVATTATISGMPDNWFGNGDKVTIAMTTSPAPSGEASGGAGSYVVGSATISCTAPCNSFTYSITATPAESATTGSVTIPGAGASATVAAGNITRSGTTGTVRGVPAGIFLTGSVVNISGAAGVNVPPTESAYLNNWQITCTDSTCSTFTFGPVPLSPVSPATGTNIQAYSSNTAPDKNLMIQWLRGQDNAGDEKGPANGVTVRPSVHGDVLHSRPLVINYGDSRGIAVFYGSNDGVYRAINGNQSAATRNADNTISVPAGGEFWGFILPEHFNLINRYRANAPELKFPGTFLATALPKDYFVDGPTGSYQILNADGTVNRAIIYLTMRRGGRIMYALDVTDPFRPRRLWSINQQSTGFGELGQTWSRPRFTLLQNYTQTTTNADGTTTRSHVPVLVFGAGYDAAEDSEPPTGDTMGRGIFIVNALTGAKVFSASVSCPANTDNCRQVPGMKYATPSDIAFVDRDADGYIDKLYWGDLGGNVWRADVADSQVANWRVTRVAQLGCNTGECAAGMTPRKFFFPPTVLSIRPSGAAGSYEALSLVSGDREHPLRDTANAYSAFNVQDRFFMIKDMGTSLTDLTLNTVDTTSSSTDLFNATYVQWDGTLKGFYINFVGTAWNPRTNQPDPSLTPTKGEKAVNAPTVVNGQVFFSTNQPQAADATCKANLGTARAYAISPFTGVQAQNVLAGGGLPPSAVSGVINIVEVKNGREVTTQEKFCIGCGLSGSQLGGGGGGAGTGGVNSTACTSALENCNGNVTIPKNLKRTYWYKK